MTSRVNTVFVVLLMVLSVVASGLGTAPTTTQNELNENTPTPLFSGNNSSAMEWVQAWPASTNYSSNDIINISWSAGDLVTNITYNVTVDIYAYNATTNTTYVIWDDFTVFNSTSNASSGNWYLPSATLPTGCYYASIGLYDYSNGSFYDNDGFDLDVGMDCSGGSGNNSSAMEWVQAWPGSTNYSTNDIINISWSAGDLVTNITYNVTVDIYAYNATTNTTYVIWDDFTVFNATSNASSGIWYLPSATLSPGCYYASIDLYDNTDGMHFDNDGFELGVETDCSGGSGNNSSSMEQISATLGVTTNYSTNDIIYVWWLAEDLVTNISYNATLDVYAYNVTTNTTYVIWDDYTVFDSNHTSWNSSGQSVQSSWQIPSGTLPTGCYFASVSLYDNSDGMYFDSDGFDLDVGMDCSGGSGNNSSSMEWVQAWPGSTNYSTNDIINISWSAGNLLGNNEAYKVTVDIYAHNSTTNTTYVIWDNFTIFWSTSNSTTDWWNLPSATLPTGCYYASIGLYDYSNGSFYDNDGFDLDVGMDCSGGSGNNSSSMEWVQAWPESTNYTTEDIPIISWNASDLVTNITYNVTLDIYAHNSTTNTTYVIYNDYTVFTATSNADAGWWNIPNGTLAAGCYFASIGLYDNTDGMHFDNDGFDLDIGMDCSGGSGNGTVNPEWINVLFYDTVSTNNSYHHYDYAGDVSFNMTMYGVLPGENYNMSYSLSHMNSTSGWTDVYLPSDKGFSGMNGGVPFYVTDGNGNGTANEFQHQFYAGCWNLDVELFNDAHQLVAAHWGEMFTVGDPLACDTNNNNTGNTTDDCGTLDNLTDLMVWTDQAIYYEGDTVEGTFVTNCTVLNNTYILDYILFDSNNNSVSNNSANPWTWVANYVAESHTLNFTGLTADTYCLWAHLEDAFAAQSIDSDASCFEVIAPTTAWGNGTARFIYIKPLAQSADEHTPFNLTFPAPPMGYGSPYTSNMICSKAAGHSADVWETYVPMPFNNITSWKVENTYGIVMGMFVMYDAQAAGIYSMQNPTVIFEQNMSFSGHAPSTLVDQANFNCPMVTVSSSLSAVTTTTGSVISYVAEISVNNSGVWTGDLNWEVATVTNGSSTALTDVAGHLLIEATGALLDYDFSPTGIVVADEICLNWQLIDENGDELSSGSECIVFTPISGPICTTVTISNVNDEYEEGADVVVWFSPDANCNGHSLAYFVNSSTSVVPQTDGTIDIDYNNVAWATPAANQWVMPFEIFNLLVGETCVTVQVSAYDAAGGVISPYIDSDTVCFNVVTTATEECTPWNNAECNTEFACPDGFDKVAVEATDNITGDAIEIWDCQESEESDEESGGLLPSVGVFGTLTASVFAVFIIALRRDEE